MTRLTEAHLDISDEYYTDVQYAFIQALNAIQESFKESFGVDIEDLQGILDEQKEVERDKLYYAEVDKRAFVCGDYPDGLIVKVTCDNGTSVVKEIWTEWEASPYIIEPR